MAGDCGSSCPTEGGWYEYNPSIPGNVVLSASFALLIPLVLYFGFRYGTATFSAVLVMGLGLEFAGFLGRVLLHNLPDDKRTFLLVELGTILGPTLITASILVVLPHLLAIYGWSVSPVRPLIVAAVSYMLVIATVVLQVVGVVFMVGEFQNVTKHQGTLVVAASLGVQIFALLWFFGLYIWLSINISNSQHGPDFLHQRTYSRSHFKHFILNLELSAGLLLVYTIYRLLEMVGGVTGPLFQNQIVCMVMNGLVPFLATLLLTVTNPGRAFTLSVWAATSPRHGKMAGSRHASTISSSHTHNPLSHSAHIRYDPNIRSRYYSSEHHLKISPYNPYDSQSKSSPKYNQTPHQLQSKFGSPGLPTHPRMIREFMERRGSDGTCFSEDAAGGASGSKDGGGPRGSQEFRDGEKAWMDRKGKPKMVDSEAIW